MYVSVVRFVGLRQGCLLAGYLSPFLFFVSDMVRVSNAADGCLLFSLFPSSFCLCYVALALMVHAVMRGVGLPIYDALCVVAGDKGGGR